jgi:hypothetical protein
VAFKYRVSGSDFGIPYSYIVNDVAATVGGAVVEGIGQWSELTELDGVTAIAAATQTALSQQERRPAAQLGTFDFQGQIIKGVKGSILTMPLNLADPAGEGAALAFWQGLFPELANVSGLAFYQDPGGAVAPLVVDPTGAAINTGVYGNILLDGQVAPWMQAGNISTGAPAQCVHATITAYFSYADNSSPAGDTAVNAGAVQCHAKTIQLKLTNLTAGNFSSVTGVLSAEAIPYGLAGYIYGIETIPQYQGKLTLVEQEISDACPIGSVLNLSGGRAEWAAMNACVQRVNYDDCGRTEIVFGPAEHLDIADIVAMNRFNRGPRWLYEVGSDQMNAMPAGQGTVALGSHVPLAAPSPGNAVRSDLLIPQSLKDLQSHQSGYTKLLPGVYAWSKGAQKSGLSLLDAGPGLALAGGSDGTLDGQYVVISVAQLLSVVAGQPVKFFELNTCENGDSTYYRTFLCTDKYHHP